MGRYGLREKEVLYKDGILKGLTKHAAARHAGYSEPHKAVKRLNKQELLQETIAEEQVQVRAALQITRQDVIEGFKDAIDHARLIDEPSTMVRGWEAISKTLGLNAPEQKELKVSIEHRVHRLRQMTDEELLAMSEGETIEGEFEEVRKGPSQTQSSGQAHQALPSPREGGGRQEARRRSVIVEEDGGSGDAQAGDSPGQQRTYRGRAFGTPPAGKNGRGQGVRRKGAGPKKVAPLRKKVSSKL